MSLERARLRPARKGLLVLDPDHGGTPLPPEGRELALSSYWLRRIQDGDVLVGDEHAPAAPATPKATKPEKP